jgi:RNA polymerase sigma-70 factor (ECF subfamily)
LSKQEHTEFLELINAHRGILYKVVNLYIDDLQEREDLRQEIVFQAASKVPQDPSAVTSYKYVVQLREVNSSFHLLKNKLRFSIIFSHHF